MTEILFLALGLVNSLSLILVFLIRKNKLALLQRIGWLYLLLAVPAVYGLFLVRLEQKDARYAIFFGIFLGFLVFEWLYDFLLKLNFRENWRRNWKWSVPYLALYYSMNYGFVVMPWKTSLAWGLIMLGLFIVQIIVNVRSHPKTV